mmetsp:Transcript_1138/g.3454  ORF Transcript_1138/g.3454 Transcript_1138/m.3454 type:complete len:200 (+) Transcript_1138:585-1184(+)
MHNLLAVVALVCGGEREHGVATFLDRSKVHEDSGEPVRSIVDHRVVVVVRLLVEPVGVWLVPLSALIPKDLEGVRHFVVKVEVGEVECAASHPARSPAVKVPGRAGSARVVLPAAEANFAPLDEVGVVLENGVDLLVSNEVVDLEHARRLRELSELDRLAWDRRGNVREDLVSGVKEGVHKVHALGGEVEPLAVRHVHE